MTNKEQEKEKNQSEAAQAEEFILSNANGNGINPNPIESGNKANWDEGTAQNAQYKADATDE